MNKFKKILLAIITMYPIVYFISFMIFIMTTMFSVYSVIEEPSGIGSPDMFSIVPFIFFFHILTIIISLLLPILYIILALKNERIKSDMRIIWVLIILFGGMIAMPIYWYLYVWKEEPPFSVETNV